jgi:hypothetical protein
MPLLSSLHPLFNVDQCHAYIHTLRWKDRPLHCSRCQSHVVGPWGNSHYRPGLKRYWCNGKFNLPGYVGFFQFLRNFRQHNAFEQAEMILQAALEPVIASRAKKEEFVKCFDHFDLLQTTIN